MRRLLLLLFLSLALAGHTPAQTDPGVFAIIGFFNQRLVYLNHNTGQSHDLGALTSTAANLRIHQDRLYIINGDFGGDGGGLWVAPLDELTAAAQTGTDPDWTVVDLPDGSNPYDLAGYGDFVYVTLQQANSLIQLDASDNYAEVTTVSDLAMPQGVAVSDGIVCVAESNLGSGDQVSLFNSDLSESISLTVGFNPQMIAVDAAGNFHTVCTGDYGAIEGEAWRIEPSLDEPLTGTVALGGAPYNLTVTRDNAGNEKIVTGDEYAANPPHIYAYDAGSLEVDGSVPGGLNGGWSLAGGNHGVFIGSTTANTISFSRYDWSGYQVIHTFDAAVAALTYYEMPATSVSESIAPPVSFSLSPAWPNPFNATTTVELTLDRPTPANIALFDALGRQVRTLTSSPLAAGQHRFTVDAAGLASGSYFVVARTGAHTLTLRITLVR